MKDIQRWWAPENAHTRQRYLNLAGSSDPDELQECDNIARDFGLGTQEFEAEEDARNDDCDYIPDSDDEFNHSHPYFDDPNALKNEELDEQLRFMASERS